MLILEAIGIVGCAFAGAVDAVRARLDLFGAVLVAIVTALGGGTLRDVLLGVFPPVPLVTPWYFVVCATTALLVCAFRSKLARLRLPMEAADAVALALFTVTGATKAMQHGTPYYTAAVIGLVNGIGGGLVRDAILGRVPAVVRGEIYAIPAFGGALLLALSDLNHLPHAVLAPVTLVVIFGTRMAAVLFGWHLPTIRAKAAPAEPAKFIPEESAAERTVRIPVYPGKHAARPHPAPSRPGPAPAGVRPPHMRDHRFPAVDPDAATRSGTLRARLNGSTT
ncbi:trimeric intracellular cation channel family protein [Amycolatopsis sp. NBC_01480]|uniref:trimeric intracellular cation channel family protein n=1 Tax=Amycolatopsis sp. NBC_01480 TaxID=2903562 RepID=UPI002E2CF1B0|nr:trimeric intracellular cation channel family protein [Amycolatopsis sp. NBC_01480]